MLDWVSYQYSRKGKETSVTIFKIWKLFRTCYTKQAISATHQSASTIHTASPLSLWGQLMTLLLDSVLLRSPGRTTTRLAEQSSAEEVTAAESKSHCCKEETRLSRFRSSIRLIGINSLLAALTDAVWCVQPRWGCTLQKHGVEEMLQ
jgi:hypothetical protein